MFALDRRQLLAGLPFAAAALARSSAQAKAPLAGKQAAAFYRLRVGDCEVTAIHDGAWLRTIDEKFVRNAPYAEVQQALADSFQAPGTLTIPFTTVVVNMGG